MEFFVPRGESSQKDSIDYLKNCDVILFFITPYYGSLMEVCELKEDCKARDCPMKTGEDQISFTHCEYKMAIAEEKLHQTYLVEKDWELVEYLNKILDTEFDLQNLKKINIFKEIPLDFIKKYKKVCKYAIKVREEISKEAYGKIEQITIPETLELIKRNLADAIIDWHYEKKLNFMSFWNRREELNNLIRYSKYKVEIVGVGGIGKTTLIQVALLLLKLKGKNIINVGIQQSYSSGAGYEYFKTKCIENQYKVIGTKINLDDIIAGLSKISGSLEDLKGREKDYIVKILPEILEKEDIVLFIDDFYLASKDVRNLVKKLNRVMISSRKNSGLMDRTIQVLGINKDVRYNYVKSLGRDYEITLSSIAVESIAEITEGHPTSTKLLVRNSNRINFEKYRDYRIDLANTEHVEEFYKRVIEDILSQNALKILRDISVLNSELDSNLDREIIESCYDWNKIEVFFNELIDTGLLIKKLKRENVYIFSFGHIQDALKQRANKKNHVLALKYYKNKIQRYGLDINDEIEILFHESKIEIKQKYIETFTELQDKIHPTDRNFKKLIEIGRFLRKHFKNDAEILILTNLGILNTLIKRFNEALNNYSRASLCIDNIMDSNLKLFYLADIQKNYGILYRTMRVFDKAEEFYLQALKIFIKVNKKTDDQYLKYIAWIESNLGSIYRNLRKFSIAEKFYRRAYRSYEILRESDSKYEVNLSWLLIKLGVLYRFSRKFEESEKSLKRAEEITTNLVKKDRETYLPDLAAIKNNLGLLNLKLKRFKKAEFNLLASFRFRKYLFRKNPEVYLPDLARVQNNLGILYAMISSQKKARKKYKTAKKYFEILIDRNKSVYTPFWSVVQNNMAITLCYLSLNHDARKFLMNALNIQTDLVKRYPEVYTPDLAMVLNNLGICYSKINKINKALECYNKALKLYKNIPKYKNWYSREITKIKKNLKNISLNSKMEKNLKFYPIWREFSSEEIIEKI